MVKANGLLPQIKKASDRLHLAWVGPASLILVYQTVDQDFPDQMRIMGDTVRLGFKGCDFSFQRTDGQFVDYSNQEVSDGMTGPRGQFFHASDKPTWTKAKAIEIGAAFLKIFIGSSNVKLGQPEAEYLPGNGEYPKRSTQGYWRVVWPRVDSEGHPFFGDLVSLEIPEGASPLGAGVFLSTPFQEEPGAIMTAAEAISKARSAIATRTFLGSSEFFSAGDRIVSNKFISSELLVVLPAKDLKVMGGPSGTARLAWELWFRPKHLKKQEGPGYNDSFAIWVDAHNGKILGRYGYL